LLSQEYFGVCTTSIRIRNWKLLGDPVHFFGQKVQAAAARKSLAAEKEKSW
jgi:hypothetical protein